MISHVDHGQMEMALSKSVGVDDSPPSILHMNDTNVFLEATEGLFILRNYQNIKYEMSRTNQKHT